MKKKPHLGDESGASLMLVIIFVMIFGVIISVILDFASTGFKTSEAIVDIRTEQHAFDGAMDGAINAIRGSSKGLTNNDCVSPADDFVYTDPDIGMITVTCDGTGGSSGSSTDNIPEYAVLTLGTDPSEGFIKTGNRVLTIDGGIFSNSKIDVTQSEISVFGDAYAMLGCPPEAGGVPTALFATGETDCGRTAAEPDPNYAPAVANTAGLPVDPPATCVNSATNTRVVKFVPGVYTKLPKYHVPANCNGSVWWLSPGTGNLGVYYFNFPDAESLWDLHTDAVAVVGGTPSASWAATGENTEASAIRFPGACAPGTEAAPNPGVQVIFGGETRWSQQDHSEAIELCTWGPATGQRLAFYGLRPSEGSRTAVPNVVLEGATAAGTNFLPNPPNPARSASDGGAAASAQLAGGTTTTASLTVSNFADVPAGARIDAATIEITHTEGGTHPAKANLDVMWESLIGTIYPIPSGSPCELTINTTVHTDVCNILPELNKLSESAFPYKALNGLNRVTIDVDASSLQLIPGDNCLKPNGTPKPNCTPTPAVAETATVSVDSIVLKVTYTPIGFEAHRCATITTPPSCNILETKTNPTVYFRGTFYAPTARVLLDVHNNGRTVFNRGIIARMIVGNASASSKQTDSPFQLPGLVATREVLFEAHLGGPTGPVRLRAKVQYNDSKNGTALPGYEVKVLSWVVIR